MKGIVTIFGIALLAGCGVETATTAATSAAIKKQEIEQGRKTEADFRQKLEQTMQQGQQRADRAGDEPAR